MMFGRFLPLDFGLNRRRLRVSFVVIFKTQGKPVLVSSSSILREIVVPAMKKMQAYDIMIAGREAAGLSLAYYIVQSYV
jgi:hypothetical protein